MNIVYISHLSGSQYGGPNYSVPAQVRAQATVDNVFWWNLSEPIMDHWINTGLFHNLKDFPDKEIAHLPKPFCKPDLVVFEDFYYIDDYKLGKECKRRKIPYIIVPRGALTREAQGTKKLKKMVANTLFFKPFTRNASAIEYLTESERENSGRKWNKKAIILPNGVNRIPFISRGAGREYIQGIYIGRFMPAKGIDLLVEAVTKIQEVLRKNRIKIFLYGPKSYDLWEEIKDQIHQNKVDDIIAIDDAVVGKEKEAILSNADFFIMTSRFEGMPMGLIEALGFSLPCIATSGTNLRNEIEQANAGWGCNTDVDSIASALTLISEKKDKLPEMRENAYRLAGEYEWNTLAIKAHNLYEEILKGRNIQ